MFDKLIEDLFSKNKKSTKQRDFEWENFQKTAKEQFIWFREKRIRFPIQ